MRKLFIFLLLFVSLTRCNPADNVTQALIPEATTVPEVSVIPTLPILPTGTSSPTMQPSLTPFRRIIPTNALEPTPDTRLLSKLAGDPLILFIAEGKSHFNLLNTVSGELWELKFPPETMGSYDFVAWSRNGCEMIIGPHNAFRSSVVRMDLKGNIVEELFTFENINEPIGAVALSPSEDMLAYAGIGGVITPVDRYPRYWGSFLDVIDLINGSGVYRLTEHVIPQANMLAWSPDGKYIAYGERDQNQVIQVVMSRPDGSGRKQLTQFTDPIAELSTISWSPSGSGIAFKYSPEIYKRPDTYVVFLSILGNNASPNFIEVDGNRLHIDNFWWQNDSTIVVSTGSLLWIDVTSNQLIDTLDKSVVPEGYISWVSPIKILPYLDYFQIQSQIFICTIHLIIFLLACLMLEIH